MGPLRTTLCSLAALLALCGLARADPGLRYDIEVRLDPTGRTLVGTQRIQLENHARRALRELVFHLYLNAFRDTRSVFMREGGARLRGSELRRPGSIRVTRLGTAAGDDLLASAQAELVPGDFTQLRVHLPAPLPSEATLELTLDFEVQLPEMVARSGFADDFYLVGQWFPKLAKLEDDGSFSSFPYHGFGEFYADFADYDYRVQVPADYVVAGSGERVEARVDGPVRVERYAAHGVHDVVWAASPYLEARSVKVGKVELVVYAERGYEAAAERQLRVLAAALPYFESHYGSYPYRTLRALIPPSDAHAASGMEYPTMFVSDGPWWALPAWLPDPLQDIVAVHELAHQWFSGMLASDEVAYPMLDEGLAQWSSLDFLGDFYTRPPSILARWPLGFGPLDVMRALHLAKPRAWPSSLLSADRYSAATLGPTVYARPALVLERVAERRGRARLAAALKSYALAQRFRHPTPDDLFAALDKAFGQHFGSRVVRSALEGKDPQALRSLPEAGVRKPSGYTFLPELWTIAQLVASFFGS